MSPKRFTVSSRVLGAVWVSECITGCYLPCRSLCAAQVATWSTGHYGEVITCCTGHYGEVITCCTGRYVQVTTCSTCFSSCFLRCSRALTSSRCWRRRSFSCSFSTICCCFFISRSFNTHRTALNTGTLSTLPQTSIQALTQHHHRPQYRHSLNTATDLNTGTHSTLPQTSIQAHSQHHPQTSIQAHTQHCHCPQ